MGVVGIAEFQNVGLVLCDFLKLRSLVRRSFVYSSSDPAAKSAAMPERELLPSCPFSHSQRPSLLPMVWPLFTSMYISVSRKCLACVLSLCIAHWQLLLLSILS